MTEPRRKRRGRWTPRARLISPTALVIAAGLAGPAAEVQAQAPAKPRPVVPAEAPPPEPARPRTAVPVEAPLPAPAKPRTAPAKPRTAPAKPRTPAPAKPAAPAPRPPPTASPADPLAPTTKPPPPQSPRTSPAADPADPLAPTTKPPPVAGEPRVPAAAPVDPLAALREVNRTWLYERVQGASPYTLERPPGARAPARVRCKIAAWSPPPPLVGARLECQALRAPDDRPEGPAWSRYLIFDAAGVREVDERAPTDRSRTGALTFPRELDGTWRLDERGAGGRRAQVTVREEAELAPPGDAPSRRGGAPAPPGDAPTRWWLAEASRWPPADPARRGPDVQIARLVPGLGPVLLCASEGPGLTYECLRLVDEPAPRPAPSPPQPARVAVASHQAHDPSSLTSREVARKIESAYAPAVLRCYQAALGKRPGLRGTLALRLTVNAVGKVEGLAASGVDAGVAACVKAAAAAWRFPIPISDFASPRTARFTLGLALSPPS